MYGSKEEEKTTDYAEEYNEKQDEEKLYTRPTENGENNTTDIKEESTVKIEDVQKKEETILANKEHRNETPVIKKETEPKVEVKKEKNTETKKNTENKTTNKKGSAQTYTVKSGDNLTEIAGSYNVDVSELKEWNGLES